MNLKSSVSKAEGSIVSHMNKRKEDLEAVRTEVHDGIKSENLSADHKEELENLLVDAQTKWETFEGFCQNQIKSLPQSVENEQEFKTSTDQIANVRKLVTAMGKGAAPEALALSTSLTTVRDRIRAIMKLTAELHKSEAAKSANELRSQAPGRGASREPAIINILRHHVKAKGELNFENVGCQGNLSAYFADIARIVVASAKKAFSDPISNKILQMDYFKAHSEWVVEYVKREGLTQDIEVNT